MANDTSAATVAKRKQLEQQLADAKADLEEAEYEHSIEVQEDALNKQYEAYEKERNEEIDKLRESLNDRETILAESFETVKNNASLVGQEIATIATEHGVTVSNALISSWQSGEMAIASYGEVLSQNTSAFIGNIMGVENEIWNLQAQANTTADSLAWMFSTKADNLVNELTTSYYAESNLANMTQALQNSLINTLERGYDVSSIVNSLNSIASSLNGIGSAAEETGKKLLELQDKYSSSGGGGGGQSGHLIEIPSRNLANVCFAAYAGGTRSSKGEIFISDEEGYELKLPKLSNGQYTIANEGTQVFTKEQTDRLYELANTVNSDNNMIPLSALTADDIMKLWGNMKMQEPVVDRKMQNSNPIQIGSMLTIQGSVDNSNIKQMESIANKAVDRFVNKMYDGMKYGR